MAQPQDSLRKRIITDLSADLLKYYLNAESARKMTHLLKENFDLSKYNKALNIDEFNYEITKDLRRISNDKHLTITSAKGDFFDTELYQRELEKLTEKQRRTKFRQDERKYQNERKNILEDNYSYGDVKILPGNIGYLEIRSFDNASVPDNKKKVTKIADVVRFLSNTTSLIIDLRENSGGSVEQVAKFVSFFSGSTRKYLFTIQSFARYDSAGIQQEMMVPIKRYSEPDGHKDIASGKKIFILVSNHTFSAAESVAYLIKKINPDTKIIGETTMGGGHVYGDVKGGKYYTAVIPTGKFIDEENGGYSFEGVGVEPDVRVRSDEACDTAYRYATGNLNISAREIKYLLKEETLNSSIDLSAFFPGYIGNYKKIQILKNKNDLFLSYDGRGGEKLIAKAKDMFQSANMLGIQFLRDSSDSVIAIRVEPEQQFFETFFKVP